MLSLFFLILSFYHINGKINFTPTGKYCGHIGNLISITAKIKTHNFIDLNIRIFGRDFNCFNEEVILQSNNTITFPNSFNRQNCIYKIFDEFGRTNINFSYNDSLNIVNVQLPMGLLQMSHCN